MMPTDMSHWADGTRHYRIGDRDYAVEATTEHGNVIPVGFEPLVDELLQIVGDGRSPVLAVVRPTVVFACTPEGSPTVEHGLTPLRTFPAGTTHEQAVAQLEE